MPKYWLEPLHACCWKSNVFTTVKHLESLANSCLSSSCSLLAPQSLHWTFVLSNELNSREDTVYISSLRSFLLTSSVFSGAHMLISDSSAQSSAWPSSWHCASSQRTGIGCVWFPSLQDDNSVSLFHSN